MRKETKILKSDHNPIKVGDNVLVDIKTKSRKPKTPDSSSDNSGRKPPKPPIWFQAFEERNNSRFDKIEFRLGNLESDVKGIKADINDVVTLNNLKRSNTNT